MRTVSFMVWIGAGLEVHEGCFLRVLVAVEELDELKDE